MDHTQLVRSDVDGPIARITLCRPDVHNAQNLQVWEELRDIGRQLPGDVRCVILAGQGASFSSGIDLAVLSGRFLSELAQSPDNAADARLSEIQAAFEWLRRPDLVSIAAVQGHAIGAGLQLALACDLRVLAADAQLRIGEPGLGLVPDLGGTKRLIETVGYSRALELSLTGRSVGAGEAMRVGLASIAVENSELDDTVDDLAAALLAVPRNAAIETKALLQRAVTATSPDQLGAERAASLRQLRHHLDES